MIKKAYGQTRTENILSRMCEKTFLKAWSYANPIKDDKKEFCDLIAIFDNHMFIFFDREKTIGDDFFEKAETIWDRWYRTVIEDQTRSCHGAERYIRSTRKIYLDTKSTIFPISYDPQNVLIHKIIIANGAKDACLAMSENNVNGSLGISYRKIETIEPKYCFPFMITIDKDNPIHVFDSFNLPIILTEMDTFCDFKNYIVEKERATNEYSILAYCGEEDLLAHYMLNYNEKTNLHYIGTNEKNINCIMIGEGEWNDFIKTPAYKSKKEADKISYTWDRLIQKTCENALTDRLGGDANIFSGNNAIFEMAKEPRIMRRSISEGIVHAVNKFPNDNSPITRHFIYIPSYYPKKAYVFLQLKVEIENTNRKEYREVRQFMLDILCGATKNKFPDLETVIGIAVEPLKLYKQISEDFAFLDCKEWTHELEEYYRIENEHPGLRFYLSGNLVRTEGHVKEFPDGCIIPE